MVSDLHKDIITNAIRVLRARRVRPNLKKIAWLVEREHALSEKTLLTLIEALVESKDILRVHFKGAISYRIPPSNVSASYEEDSFDSESIDNCSSSVQQSSDSEQEFDAPEADVALRAQSDASHILKSRRGGGNGGKCFRGGLGGSSSNRGGRTLTHQGGGSAPRPRLHAGPQNTPTISSISDTISRVIMTGGNNSNNINTNSSSSSNHSSSGNGSVTPKSGRSTPTLGGSEGDSNEVQCIEFETPCAPPRPVAPRGTVRRGRPPLSSLGLGEARKARAPSSRPKVSSHPLTKLTNIMM